MSWMFLPGLQFCSGFITEPNLLSPCQSKRHLSLMVTALVTTFKDSFSFFLVFRLLSKTRQTLKNLIFNFVSNCNFHFNCKFVHCVGNLLVSAIWLDDERHCKRNNNCQRNSNCKSNDETQVVSSTALVSNCTCEWNCKWVWLVDCLWVDCITWRSIVVWNELYLWRRNVQLLRTIVGDDLKVCCSLLRLCFKIQTYVSIDWNTSFNIQ